MTPVENKAVVRDVAYAMCSAQQIIETPGNFRWTYQPAERHNMWLMLAEYFLDQESGDLVSPPVESLYTQLLPKLRMFIKKQPEWAALGEKEQLAWKATLTVGKYARLAWR